jgi:hypothetical protein
MPAMSLLVWGSMLLASVPVRAADPPVAVSQDVPVPGRAALAELAEVSPVPDRARFVAELARVIYSQPSTGPYSNEPLRRRIDALFAEKRQTAGSPDGGAKDDLVPVPLTAALWSQSILHRQVERRDLVGAILTDRSAALMCYGLSGMDDETLQFLAEHPSLVSRLAERAPAVVAAFGESLHIHGNRVVLPGGDEAAALWESVVGEKLNRPERFVQMLFESERGRVAYLYDAFVHLAPPTLVFALESSIREPEERANRFKRLAALAKHGFVEWDVAAAPFVRPTSALATFFARLAIDERGTPIGWMSPAFWQRVFDEGAGSPPQSGGVASIDAAWVAELLLSRPGRERERRVDTFVFAQRVFPSAAESDDTLLAVRSFSTFPALMLTIERMGIRTPAIYAAAAQQAERLTDLDMSRGAPALAQFQGAVALLSRLVRVRTIDGATAERLAHDLFASRVTDGRYNGAISSWMDERLRPALPAAATPPASIPTSIDDVLLAAVAGPPASGAARRVEWEGQRYRVDIGSAELQRLMRVREKQQTTRFGPALALARIGRRMGATPAALDAVHEASAALTMIAADLTAAGRSAADRERVVTIREAAQVLESIKRPGDLSDARKVSAPLTAVSDVMLGEALISLAYACELGDPEGTILIAGDPSVRHDFGYGMPSRDTRVKAMWNVAITETRNGPSHLIGSALALDLAMAPLALRRISTDRIPEAPMLNMVQRDSFAATVAVMDPRALTDEARDEIAAHVDRGRMRMNAVDPEAAGAIARELRLDGWRSRALAWTARQEPARSIDLLTMAELLVLGGGRPSAFDAWGTYAVRTRGCFCTQLAPPGFWQSWWGLAQVGLPATLVSDLPLRVAVVLHNLQLPAVLAKPVLAAAMQDFVDSVNPTDGNDWLTLARAVQVIGAERFEDYVAAATADGPLVPETPDR